MTRLLKKEPFIQPRTLSSMNDSVALGHFSPMYQHKESFDLKKLHTTLVSILEGQDHQTFYNLTRYGSNPRMKTLYATEDKASYARLNDIIELLDFIQNSHENDDLYFKTLLFANESAADSIHSELLEQGVDVTTKEGHAEVAKYFWGTRIHLVIEHK